MGEKGNRTYRTFPIHDRQGDSDTNTSQWLLAQPSKWRQQPESSSEACHPVPSLSKQSNVGEANGFAQEAMYCTDIITQNNDWPTLKFTFTKTKFRNVGQLTLVIPGLQRLGQADCLMFKASLRYNVRPCPKQKKKTYIQHTHYGKMGVCTVITTPKM